MFGPGSGVVGITATDGSISSRLLGQPSHRSHLTQGTIWASILRRTTAALSNIPPRPDGALGLRVVAPDAAIAALIRGQSKRVGDEAVPLERRAVVLRRIDDQMVPWVKCERCGGCSTSRDEVMQSVAVVPTPHRRGERNRLGTTR